MRRRDPRDVGGQRPGVPPDRLRVGRGGVLAESVVWATIQRPVAIDYRLPSGFPGPLGGQGQQVTIPRPGLACPVAADMACNRWH